MTALERAARAAAHAMHTFYNGEASSELVWASMSEETRESFTAQARAVLLAVRELDRPTVLAGHDAYMRAASIPGTFTAMIDAILSEGETK